MDGKKIYEIPECVVAHFETEEIMTDSGNIELPVVPWGNTGDGK